MLSNRSNRRRAASLEWSLVEFTHLQFEEQWNAFGNAKQERLVSPNR